jgi:hypothetical protein
VVGLSVVELGWIGWYFLRPRVRYSFGAWNRYSAAGERIEPPGLSRKWKIGIGLLVPASLFVLFLTPLSFGIDAMIRNSGAYKLAFKTAQGSTCVSNALGSPLESRWMVSGNMEESSIKGSAELDIPIKGPKGKGNLDVHATKLNGNWIINSLVFSHGTSQSSLVPSESSQACQ